MKTRTNFLDGSSSGTMTGISSAKMKGASDLAIRCSWLCTLPRYFALTLADFAYRTGQVAPVQAAVIGTLPEAPTFWWSTASSFEQKLRIPVTL